MKDVLNKIELKISLFLNKRIVIVEVPTSHLIYFDN